MNDLTLNEALTVLLHFDNSPNIYYDVVHNSDEKTFDNTYEIITYAHIGPDILDKYGTFEEFNKKNDDPYNKYKNEVKDIIKQHKHFYVHGFNGKEYKKMERLLKEDYRLGEWDYDDFWLLIDMHGDYTEYKMEKRRKKRIYYSHILSFASSCGEFKECKEYDEIHIKHHYASIVYLVGRFYLLYASFIKRYELYNDIAEVNNTMLRSIKNNNYKNAIKKIDNNEQALPYYVPVVP